MRMMTAPAACLIALIAWTAAAAPPAASKAGLSWADSVVLLGTLDDGAFTARASGVVVGTDAVLTLAKPFEGEQAVAALARDGTVQLAKSVIVNDLVADLLLLQVSELEVPPVPLSRTSIESEAEVEIVSAPLLWSPQSARGSLRKARVTANGRRGFAVDAAMPPVGVGGLVLTSGGEPVGVVTGAEIMNGEPLVIAVELGELAAFAKTRPKSSREPASARRSTSSSAPVVVGIPLVAPPPAADHERRRQLSDAKVAEALDASDQAVRERHLVEAARWDPHSSGPWILLARLLDRSERLEEAGRAYEAAATLSDDKSVDHCALAALALHKRELHEDAVTVAQRCRRAAKEHPMSLAVHGSALAAMRDFQGAAPLLRRALQLDRQLGWARAVLAVSLHEEGRIKEALAEYRLAAKTTPKKVGLWQSMAEAHVADGALKEAAAAYRKACALAPENVSLFVRLAELELAVDDKEAARRSLRRALAIDPKNAQAKSLLEEMNGRGNGRRVKQRGTSLR